MKSRNWFIAIFKVIGAALLIILGTMAVLMALTRPGALPGESESAKRLVRGAHPVESLALVLRDDSRETKAIGGFPGSDFREFKGTVWFPKANAANRKSRLPLVVYSHGFGSYHKAADYLTEWLAASGYVVAAIDFPLTSMFSPTGFPDPADAVNQPGDLSFLIDRILVAASDPQSPLFGLVDPDKIAAVGLSLGGLTTTLIAYHDELRDDRLKAAVAMAPPVEVLTERFYQTRPGLPYMLIAGTKDNVVNYEPNMAPFPERNPAAWLLSLDGGTHLGFASFSGYLTWMKHADEFACLLLGYITDTHTLDYYWHKVLGGEQAGIAATPFSPPCLEDYQSSLNPLRQQDFVKLSVEAFLDMHLKEDGGAGESHYFFEEVLPRENPEIRLRQPRRLEK